MVAVMSLKGELVAVGESVMSSKNVMKEDKGKVVKINKVFMKTETYFHYKKD